MVYPQDSQPPVDGPLQAVNRGSDVGIGLGFTANLLHGVLNRGVIAVSKNPPDFRK